MTLAVRLTIAMVALVLVTATAAGLMIYNSVETVAVPRALERTEMQARLLASRFDSYVQSAVRSVLGFRAAVAIDGIVRARRAGGVDPADGASEATWRARLARRFVAELEARTEFLQFRVIGIEDDGREIVRVERAGSSGKIRVVPDDELQRKGDRPFFQEALLIPAGMVYVSPIELDQERGVIGTPHVPVLRTATKILTPDGDTFGIVVINVDLRPIFSTLRKSMLQGHNVLVVNKRGDYLLHPDTNREFGFEFGTPHRVQQEYPGIGGAIDAEQGLKRIVKNSVGETFGMAIQPIDLGGTMRVAVVVTDTYASIMRPALAVRQASVLAGLLSIVGAIVLAIILARTLSRPLQRMTQAVQQLGHGKPVVIEADGGGEIGILARAFADMATEIREKTTALERESDERKRIFDTSLDLILVVDSKGYFVQINPSSAAILGYRPDEMIGHNAEEFIYPDDLESTRSEMRLARRGRLMRNFECRYVHKSGRVVVLNWTGVWSEPVQRHFFIGRDMTDMKQAEEKFRLAVEACPSGMVMADRNGKIIMVNSEIERLFGYRRNELIGQPVEMLVPEDHRAHHSEYRVEFMAAPESRRMGAGRHLSGRRKDGSEFPVEVGLNPVHSQEGPVVLGVVVDISERQRNDRLKDEFVSTVSHELRTPMTSVAGSLGLLIGGAAGALPAPAQRLLSIAYSNSQRLVRLINDILDIQKIESGKMMFDLKPVDIRAVVEQAVEATRGFAINYGARVTLAGAETATVRADIDRLTQVLTNLLSNAIKFSPEGGEVEVLIAARADTVRVSVRDHGPGIPEDFRSRIFEKFAQADASDTRHKSGTGLGLNIVKQIVMQHGGSVGFHDAEGGGTVFYFELPYGEGTAVAPVATPQGSIPRVLLCEDDADAAATVASHLRLMGYEVSLARTGGEALARAEGSAYGAILIDLKLPDLDGVSLIQRLRALPGHANTPIIVVSGYVVEGRADVRSAALNVLDWLNKPVDVERVMRLINGAIADCRNSRPRILHVDDDHNVLKLVSKSLEGDADVLSVDSIEEARRALAQMEFDLAVLDLSLGDGSSMVLLPELRNHGGGSIPVVVFSGQDANPSVAARVDALLNKSRTSIDDLVRVLRTIAVKGAAPATKEVA